MENPERAKEKETPKETFERYLEMLGLKMEDLEGKTILDIGALGGEFAIGAKEAGVNAKIVSLDRNDVRQKNPDFPEDLERVVSGTEKLPFADEEFDYVFSVSALPTTAHMNLVEINGKKITYDDFFKLPPQEKEEYCAQVRELTKEAIAECVRVEKKGGEIRFGSSVLRKLPEGSPYLKVDETIRLGIYDALRGESVEVVSEAKRAKSGLWVIKKLEDREESL